MAAGQRASVQRELQGLNTSLANFKSAGGIIPANAAAADAIGAMQAGVTIAGTGSSYEPLSSTPEFTTSIGGIPYELAYDEETGFYYAPTGSNDGEIFSGSGTGELSADEYPFDITDPAAIAQALEDFAGMDPTDPMYQSYLDALTAASTLPLNLPEETLAAITAALAGPTGPSYTAADAQSAQDILAAAGAANSTGTNSGTPAGRVPVSAAFQTVWKDSTLSVFPELLT